MACSASLPYTCYLSTTMRSSSSSLNNSSRAKTLAPQALPLLQYSHGNRVSRFSPSRFCTLTFTSKKGRGSAFRAPFSFQDSSSQTVEEKGSSNSSEASEIKPDKKYSSDLKSLFHLYQMTIRGGDEKTIADIEKTICMVEKEKNELLQKVSTLSAEINSRKETFIRVQADFDNCRKRSEKERLSVSSDSQGEVIERLLPMVDNFERAKQQLKLETEKEKKIDTSYQGIYKQFVEIMRSLGVSAVPTVGKPFDPSLHEAIAREESQEFKEGIIIQEFRRGFLLGNRLLRPATVKVSTGSSGKRPSSTLETSSGQPAAAVIDNQ